MTSKLWVVLGNLAIISICGFVSLEAYKQDAPSLAMVGGIFIFLGLWAIFDTITGR